MVVLISVLVLWIISLCLHEYGHARVAYAGGDYTVAEKGYLTLNPLKYMHPVMSLVIPVLILLLGGVPLPGGAVYINTHLLRNHHWSALVSIAGPAANLALLVLVGLLFRAGYVPGMEAVIPGSLAQSLALFGFFMAFAFIINMLPIPGLDGFGVIEPYLPREAQEFARSFSNMGILLLIVVLKTVPEAQIHLRDVTRVLAIEWAGIPERAVWEAFASFQGALGR
ncbi:MAG TPA: site-2 protease family protein [Planctomycetota bacterium]|jgi:Zn-dependent protease|nr:site-2 protease family protein [Planctomycetota bacterium]